VVLEEDKAFANLTTFAVSFVEHVVFEIKFGEFDSVSRLELTDKFFLLKSINKKLRNLLYMMLLPQTFT
jgi:hypothetical protein